MILLFMQGGPSQLETFDPKPGTENGGPTQAISTAVSGIQIAEGWEQTAKQMQDIAIIRSMTNKEGQHDRATYQMHTGYIPSGSIKHPSLGCNVARELAHGEHELPADQPTEVEIRPIGGDAQTETVQPIEDGFAELTHPAGAELLPSPTQLRGDDGR